MTRKYAAGIAAGIAAGMMLLGMTGLAHASSITVTYTADNDIDALYLVDLGNNTIQSFTVGPNADNWKASDSITLSSLTAGTAYELIWVAQNAGGATPTNLPTNNGQTAGGDPAAFLGQITGDIVGGSMYSSTNSGWNFAVASADSTALPTTWASVTTEFGTNGGDNIWESVNGRKIRHISTSAEWIWSNGNNPYVDIMAEFTTSPASGDPSSVPEPAAMILFGTGLAGLAGVLQRRRA